MPRAGAIRYAVAMLRFALSIAFLASSALAQEAAPAAQPNLTDRDLDRGFQLDLTIDAWFPRLVGDVTFSNLTSDVSDLNLHDSEVVFSGSGRATWDRCFVQVSGFTFDTDGATTGFRNEASWWDVSVDVGYALWRPFNDSPAPWSNVQHWEGNQADGGGYRFELALAPTIGCSWDDVALSVEDLGAVTTQSLDGGWAALRFGGEFVATLHTKDLVSFLQSFEVFGAFSVGPTFGAGGDADGTGVLWVIDAGGRIFFTPNIAVHLGYRLYDADFEVSSGDSGNLGLQGLVAGASIRF